MSLYETIPYKVISKEDSYEIREYDNFLLASTKTKQSNRYDSGFSNVFNYISGNNTNNQKISMTTPVVSYEDKDQLVTGFYVPSKYNKETVPLPSTNNVYIEEQPSSLYGVIKFKGSWTEANFKKNETLLIKYLNKNRYSILSNRFLFRYQPPFIPAIFRRNEIAFQIKKA